MKVQFNAESKKQITVSLMPEVKKLIAEFKEDESKVSDYANSAGYIASGRKNNTWECLKAEAIVSRNCRVWNRFSDNSEDLDVWMKFYVYDTYYGFYEIGAYISDLWQADGTAETSEEIKNHMFILEFKKQ